MSERKSTPLDHLTDLYYTGDIINEEMRRKDFRKALQIIVLSFLSALIATAIALSLNF